MTPATIKDLARELKLSPSTVSRALRDHPDISPKTKKRVVSLADKLDYHPDSIAQSLQTKKTKTIGVIVPEIKQPFFASVINGIEELAYAAGYTIIVCQSNETADREVLVTRSLGSHRVAGLLVSLSRSTENLDHFKVLQRRGVPIVFFDRVSNDIEASKVVVDDYKGAFDVVEHLIKSGYNRFAHLAGPKNLSISKFRLKGYTDALQAASLRAQMAGGDGIAIHRRRGGYPLVEPVLPLHVQDQRPEAVARQPLRRQPGGLQHGGHQVEVLHLPRHRSNRGRG